MPTPNATLLASVNGGAPTTGGITAAAGDTVQFSFQNTTGWGSGCKLELSFPAGFTLPAGWSSETVDGHTVYYVLGRTTPPPITLGPWGKYMPRLIVNGGAATDEDTAISVPSPGGLLDLGHREAGQFGGSSEKWTKDQRANLRVIESGLGSPAVSVVGSSDITVTESPAGTFTLSSARREIRVHKIAGDAAAGTDTLEFPICKPLEGQWRFVSAVFIPGAGVAEDATNYANVFVRVRDSGTGSAFAYAAYGSTTPATPEATGSWTAFVPVTLPNQEFADAVPLEPPHYLSFGITKVGPSGVIIPAGVLEVTLEPWVEA